MTPATVRRVPPGPTGLALLGTLMQLSRDRLGMMTSAADRYGDAVRLGPGFKPLYFFNHPDAAKHVLADNSGNYHKGIGLVHARRALGDGLLTSEGALWREQRKVIQPVFQARRIAEQAGTVAGEAARLVDRLRAHDGGAPVDVVRELTGFTLSVLGQTLLDTDLGGFRSVGSSFEAMQDQAMFELASMSAVPMWVPLPKQLRFRRARRDLQRIVDRLAADRVAEGLDGRDDALSRLILSARSEADPRVGRQRMRDELVTLLLAGHETTASTLGWTFHMLDRHPEVWQQVHDEAVRVLGDRPPTYEDLPRLRYTSMVISEVMRLYPPVWMLSRIAQGADEVAGYPIPAGVDVLICPYTLHRNPEFWPSPERFDPERFDPGTSRHARYSYLPFGAGPRFCVGNHLGLMEATFVTAMAARELRLTTAPGYRVVPEPMLSLRVRGGLPMHVRAVA